MRHRGRNITEDRVISLIDAARRHYWQLVAALGATMGWSGSKIISAFLAQEVTPQGYVYFTAN